MNEQKFTELRETLSFYTDLLNTVEKIYYDLITRQPVNTTPDEFNETIGRVLPVRKAKLIDEIRTNLLNLDELDAGKYCAYLNKYLSELDYQISAATDPILELLLQRGFSFDRNTNKFTNTELDERYGKTSQVRQQMEYHHLSYVNLSYVLSQLYVAWDNLRQTIGKEFSITATTEQHTEPGKTKMGGTGLSMRAKVLLLHELGFFDLAQTKHRDNKQLAKIVSELISNGKDAHNIRIAVGERGSLRQEIAKSKSKRELDKINELIALLNR